MRWRTGYFPKKNTGTGTRGKLSLGSQNYRAPTRALVRAGLGHFAACLAVVVGISSAPALADEVVTHWTMPAIAIPAAERPMAPNVFGTVALPVRARQTGTRWTKLMGASVDQPALHRLAAQLQGLSQHQQVSYVQSAVDHALRARPDSHDCSDDGYWAAANETLTRGLGDCFDVAIAKMEALRSLGFAHQDLYLTTGYFQSRSEPGRRRATAALLVRTTDGFVLLSDGADPVVPASDEGELFANFHPYITYGYGMTWVHGRIVKQPLPSTASGEGDQTFPSFAR